RIRTEVPHIIPGKWGVALSSADVIAPVRSAPRLRGGANAEYSGLFRPLAGKGANAAESRPPDCRRNNRCLVCAARPPLRGRADRARPTAHRINRFRRHALRGAAAGISALLPRGGGSVALRASRDTLGYGTLPVQPAAAARGRETQARHPRSADRATDLHRRASPLGDHLPPHPLGAGPGEPGSARLAADPSLSAHPPPWRTRPPATA